MQGQLSLFSLIYLLSACVFCILDHPKKLQIINTNDVGFLNNVKKNGNMAANLPAYVSHNS